ncbi:hypothetical protein D3C81_1407480 [compost metagenome]
MILKQRLDITEHYCQRGLEIMGNVGQHMAHGLLQPGHLHRTFVIDIQQRVETREQLLQRRVTIEQKQPFVRALVHNALQLGMNVLQLASMLPQPQILPQDDKQEQHKPPAKKNNHNSISPSL